MLGRHLLFAAALTLSALAAPAQTATGTLVGRVLDPQGRPIPRASILIRNTDLASARTVLSDTSGNFRVPALPSGAFTVEAHAPGFASKRPIRLTVSVGATLHLDIPLALPAVSTTTTVRARGILSEGNTTAPDINKQDPARSQFFAGNTVTYLPNRDRTFTQFTQLTPAAQEDPASNVITLAGQRASALITQVDGVSFNDPLLGGLRGAADRAFFLPQTVVREFQVVASGLSADTGGTNAGLVNVVTKEGSNKLHGEAFYTGRPAALTSSDPFGHSLANTQNTFGGSLGGPLRRNLAFFYAGLEQDLLSTPFWSTFEPQPPGTLVPATLQSQQGQIVSRSTPTAFFGRLDLLPTPSDSLNLDLGLNRIHATNLDSADSTRTIATLAHAASLSGQSLFVKLAYTRLLTPRTVNEAAVAFSSDHRTLTPNSSAPELVVNGFGILGGNGFGSQLHTSQQFQLHDDLTLTRGANALTLGLRFADDPAYQQAEPNLNGRFDFNSLAAFLAGAPRRFQQTFPTGDIRYQGSIRELGLYANARLALTQTLTLTAGLRWDAQFNPQPQHPNPAIPLTTLIPSDLTQFQPRLGFAWNPAHKTVLRLSSGLFFAPTPASLFARIATDNGQQVAITDTYFDPQLLPLTLASGTPTAFSFLPALTHPAALVLGIAPSFRNPASAQLAASVEQELHPKLTLSAGLLHDSTWRLQRRLDLNLNPPTLNAAGLPIFPALRPNPTLGRLLVNESNAHSSYNALLLTAVSQISRRTLVTANYTLASTRDDDSGDGPFTFDTALNPFNLRAEAAPSNQDVRHTFNLSAVINLPAGLKANPVLIARSGLPYTPIIGFDTQGDANDFNDRALLNGQTAARNALRQPAFNDLDLRLVKDFTLKGEGHHLDLFLDLFNLGGASNRNFGPNAVSLYGTPAAPIFTAGQPLFAPNTTRLGGPREIQFTARLVAF